MERVIGLVRNKYRILQARLPSDMLRRRNGDPDAVVDKIVRICCALTNFSPLLFLFQDSLSQPS